MKRNGRPQNVGPDRLSVGLENQWSMVSERIHTATPSCQFSTVCISLSLYCSMYCTRNVQNSRKSWKDISHPARSRSMMMNMKPTVGINMRSILLLWMSCVVLAQTTSDARSPTSRDFTHCLLSLLRLIQFLQPLQ